MLYVNPVDSLQNARFEQVPSDKAREKEALQEFERLFLYTLLKEMRKTVPEEGLLDNPSTTRVYKDMLDDAWAGEMVRSEQLGIARAMEAQMRLTEQQASKDSVSLSR